MNSLSQIKFSKLILSTLAVLALSLGTANAAVVEDIWYDITPEALSDDWRIVQWGAGVASHFPYSIAIDSHDRTLMYHQDFHQLETGNAFSVEVIVSTSSTSSNTFHGASFGVDFRDLETDVGEYYTVQVKFYRDDQGIPYVFLFNAEGGALTPLARLELEHDFENAWDRLRVRIRRQEIDGKDCLVLEAEPSSTQITYNDDTNRNSPNRIVVENFKDIAVPAQVGEIFSAGVRFGHALAVGSYQSDWETIHINFADDRTTFLPYYPSENSDSDGDGYLNEFDFCPDTMPESVILPFGCSPEQIGNSPEQMTQLNDLCRALPGACGGARVHSGRWQ